MSPKCWTNQQEGLTSLRVGVSFYPYQLNRVDQSNIGLNCFRQCAILHLDYGTQQFVPPRLRPMASAPVGRSHFLCRLLTKKSYNQCRFRLSIQMQTCRKVCMNVALPIRCQKTLEIRKNAVENGIDFMWRRRRDLNSSAGKSRPNRLATCPLRPLGYASVPVNNTTDGKIK